MGSSSPSTISNFNPQQQNLAHQFGPLLQNQVGQGITPYNGQLVAPVQGASQIQGMLGSYNPTQFSGGQTGAINQALSGQPAYNVNPQTTANYFQQSVVDPSMRTYNQVTAPAINQGFAANGGTFSTARGVAQGQALSNLQDSNAAQLASTQQSNQQLQAQLAQSAVNNQLQGVGLAQQYANQPLYNAQALTQALAPFQQNAQNQLSANYSQWQSQQSYNNPYLSDIMGFLGESTQSAYQQPNYTGQFIGAGVGAAGSLASLYGSAGQGASQASAFVPTAAQSLSNYSDAGDWATMMGANGATLD